MASILHIQYSGAGNGSQAYGMPSDKEGTLTLDWTPTPGNTLLLFCATPGASAIASLAQYGSNNGTIVLDANNTLVIAWTVPNPAPTTMHLIANIWLGASILLEVSGLSSIIPDIYSHTSIGTLTSNPSTLITGPTNYANEFAVNSFVFNQPTVGINLVPSSPTNGYSLLSGASVSNNTELGWVPTNYVVAYPLTPYSYGLALTTKSLTNTGNLGGAITDLNGNQFYWEASTISWPVIPAPVLTSLYISPSTVTANQSTSGTIYLDKLAPSNQVISLTSSLSGLTFPATVTINSGASSATFSISTSSVSVLTTYTISASLNSSVSGTLNVQPQYIPSQGYPQSTDLRYTYINWIPRWMSATSVVTSTLREFYFDTIISPKEDLKFELERVKPQFFGTASTPRRAYAAKYLSTLNYTPTITLNLPGSSFEIEYRESLACLLDEKTNFCYALDPSTSSIYFRNLAIVSNVARSSSGVLDFSYLFSINPPIADSLIVLVNYYKDVFYIQPEDPRWNGNQLNLGWEAGFYVYYESQRIYDQILNGLASVTIGNQTVPILPYFFADQWDVYSNLNDYKRKYWETNSSVRNKNQQLSFLSKADQRIASMLGRGSSVIWDTTKSYVFPLTGSVSYSVPQLSRIEYVTESPVRVGSNLLLSRTPDNYVQLIYKGVPIDPLSFVVSGSWIIPGSIELYQANTQYLQAQYIITSYTTSPSGNFLSLSREDLGSESLFLFFNDSVEASNSYDVLNVVYWNRTSYLPGPTNESQLVTFET